MATKDYCLSFKDCVSDNLSDDKYNNLNLNNQNQKSAIFQTLTTKRVSTDSKKFQTHDVLTDSRKGPNSWKKSSKNLTSNLLNADRDLEENEFKKAKNGINSSTLSLHIAAYENSNEASNFNKVEKEAVKQKGETLSMPKKWGISNHFVGVPTSTIQNPFEFPRQQDDQASRSDLMQFTASQRLLNPNQMDSNNQVKPPSMEPNDDPAAKKNAKEIGIAFVKKYYEAAIQGLDVIMELFGDCSVYVGANGKEARGLKDIRNALSKLNLQEGKILIVSMNAAFTENGGIMVQCLANYITDESSKYGFSESFHLVPQSKGWYVRSCLFKWHDETPENAKSEDSETLPEDVEQEHKHELVNDHTAEDKESTLEADVKAVAEELTKLTGGLNQPKSRNSANGTTAPPSTPTKNDSAPEKDTKSPIVSAVPATPTSWAACVGGDTKSADSVVPAITNNGSTNVKLSAATATNNDAASDITVTSPSANVTTTTANGNTSADLESTQDQQEQQQPYKKSARAKSDFTVHVSKIFKRKKATERDVADDITKAFQEFGPVSDVRIAGYRLAADNERSIYAFVDFQEKEDFEKIFADREKDNEGRVKASINIPALSFTGEVIIAQNRGSSGRNFYGNRRAFGNQRSAGNNGRFGNGRPPHRYPRYNGQSGNRPPQSGARNHSDNRQKQNETIKADN